MTWQRGAKGAQAGVAPPIHARSGYRLSTPPSPRRAQGLVVVRHRCGNKPKNQQVRYISGHTAKRGLPLAASSTCALSPRVQVVPPFAVLA